MFRRKGLWWTCIRHNGRKIQKSLETADKKMAQAIESKIRADLVEGKFFEKQKGSFLTVKDLIEKYLTEYSMANKSLRTQQDDFYFSKKILMFFGNMTLSEVGPRHISEFIKTRRADGVGDVTINHELRVLRHAYNLAIRAWELIKESPFAKIKIPKGDNTRVRYLSQEEETRLFEHLPDWLKPVVLLAKETGLRLSNLANLKWSQVDIFRKIIILETTKNGDALGIPMTDNVFQTLKNLNKVRWIDSDYIFGKQGKPFRRWWISKNFRDAVRKAGIENLRFHDLRHDFCSKLVQRGVDLYSVAGLAGHKDIKTTQRYAHLSPEKLRSAISVLNSDCSLTAVGNQQKELIL